MFLNIYMAETETDRRIKEAFKSKHGSMKQTFDILNKDKPLKDPTRVTMDAVRKWFRNNDETLKAPTGSNSRAAPGPRHELQIDAFHFKHM